MKKTMIFYKLLFAISLLILLTTIPASSQESTSNTSVSDIIPNGQEPSIAPINPAFVEYQKELEQENTDQTSDDSGDISILTLSGESPVSLSTGFTEEFSSELFFNESRHNEDEYHPTGLIPSPVDLSHLSSVNMGYIPMDDSIGFSGLELMGSVVYPSRYDLREENGITGVRDQGQAGSCWAHSTLGSLESYLLHSNSETWDFSENNVKNILVTSNTDGYTRSHDDGGFDLFTAAYLTSWKGPVMESDDPYSGTSGVSPDNLPVAKHVQEIMILPGFEGNGTLYKWMLTNYGAVSVAYWHSNSYFDSNNNSYYCTGEVEYANHAVTLVGWDDNYSASNFTPNAPGNGAYIIKNSWGDNWGEDGYFYVSYYDTGMGNNEGIYGLDTKPYGGNFVFTAENVSNYDNIYQHDPLGWTGCTGYNNTTAYGANIFTASSNETLKAVSFYTVDSNSIYNISVYLEPGASPVNSSGPVSVQNGTIAIAGYHTIDLDTNVSLNTGQNFSVVVQFTTPNYNYPVAIEMPIAEYSENAHAETGQSYLSLNGTEWDDISDSDKNICIKAFTTEDKEPEAAFVAGTKYVHVNESVDFHDASLFSVDTWEWDFGDNSTSSVQTPVHAYANPGVYNVSLNVSNSFGSNASLRSSFIHVLNSTIIVNSSGTADFTTISEAVTAASDGDTIMVEPGSYTESLYMKTDNISLMSSTGNPEDVSVISLGSSYETIYIAADNISISGMNISDGISGVFLYSSPDSSISNCTISGNFVGIYPYQCSNINILNCTITDNLFGIDLSRSQDGSISNCTISDSYFGMELYRSQGSRLTGNSLEGNSFNCILDNEIYSVSTSNTVDGKPMYYLLNASDVTIDNSSNAGFVHLVNCSNITIQDLEIENNYYGLYLYNSSDITITNCTSTDSGYGAYLSYSNNNTICGSNISDIISYGISLTGCSDNLIYNNYFNNSRNVRVSGGAFNAWNITMTNNTNIINGTYLGGNYWAEPDGTGWSQTEYSTGNGFCAAYEITDDGNNTDNLPLTTNGAQPADPEESSGNSDDGIHVRIPISSTSPSSIVAMDSSVRFVGKDAEVEYVFTDGNTPVNDICLKAETNEGYVMATVSLLNDVPKNAPSSSSVRVYQSMEIVLGDESFSSGIGEATIGFSVSKEWLGSNGFDEADIYMEHFSGDVWNRLPTVMTGEDGEYFYFEATTTGFSPFMICADVSGDEPVNAGSSMENNGEGKASLYEESDVQTGQEDDSANLALLLPGLIIVAVMGAIYWKKSK